MTIRVLWLIKGLGPGGAENLLVSAAEVRDRTRFEYEVAYLLPRKDTLVGPLEELDVPVYCLGARNNFDARWVLRLRRLLRDRRYGVVHSHSPYVASAARLVVRSLPKGERPRLVTTEHNSWDTFAVATRFANRTTASLDDAIIAVSPHVFASMGTIAGDRGQTVIHGIPLDRVRRASESREDVRRELGVSPNEVLAGTVANYRRQKDYPTLLRTIRSLIDRGLSLKFCAVGQGPLKGEIDRLRHELRLEEHLILTGYRDDPARVMSAFDLFVLASSYEGLPVALMDALALGLPVVATRVGGIPTAITNGVEGLLVRPHDVEALASGIAELTADADRRRDMGDAARIRSEEFSIERAVRQIEAVYRDVVNR